MSQAFDESVVKMATPVTFGSVCSGIEAASVAWEPLGWKAAWFAEIEDFPSAVLAHHWPYVPNLGDMTKIRDRITAYEIPAPCVLVGGTPCQAFSVAGARRSLDDDRGQLTLEYVRLLNAIDAARSVRGEEPAIAVWENVPGVLSTKDNAFGCFLGALSGEECELQPTGKKWTNAGCVFGPQRTVAWRILDAQYFGVAQRRRRVFVVASARKGFNPAEVLFECEGVRRDSAPSRGEGEKAARSAGGSSQKSGATVSGKEIFPTLQASMGSKLWLGNQEAFSGDYFICHGTQDPIIQTDQAFPLGRNHGQENAVYCLQGNIVDRDARQNGSGVKLDCAHTLNTQVRHAVAFTVRDAARDATQDVAPTMRSLSKTNGKMNGSHGLAVAFAENSRAEVRLEGGDGSLVGALSTGGGKAGQGCPTISIMGLVRRLLPIECERLQGFPDGHTLIPYRNKPIKDCPDGPRYAALGNSMAVPVMAWIGKRIMSCLIEKSNSETY